MSQYIHCINKVKYLLLLVIFLFLTYDLRSQVTIGTPQVKPESFSMLQLQGTTGGLRLNSLTTTQRNALKVSGNVLAKGLMIYNTTTNQAEIWDGSAWIGIINFSAGNGLAVSGSGVDLGNSLTKSTLITQGAYSVNFSQSTSTTSGSVGLGTSTSSLPDKSSVLELRSTNKGLLLPRVSLSTTTSTTSPISSPVKGLLVYNIATTTGTTGVAADNLYAWNGSKWNKMVDETNLTASLSNLGIPKPAVFQLDTEQTDFLNGVAAGSRQTVPMSQVVNNLSEYISYNSSTSTITFTKGGIYQITFVYEAMHNVTGCTMASYFVDFPAGSGTTRLYSAASFIQGGVSSHGNTIAYTGRVSDGKTWKIELGRGNSGNCTGTGMRLIAKSTHMNVLRIGD